MNSELSPLLRAAHQLPGDRVPVWFMRQAGRSLPEYLEVRGNGSILDAIQDPDKATEITLQPVRRYGVDAAILFSDIVTPVWASGFGIDIKPGVGPVCEQPFSNKSDLNRLRPIDDSDLKFQTQTVNNLVDELSVPLIGFAGAPFTLAAYLIEGKPSKGYTRVKSLMVTEPDLWNQLCDRLADLAIATLTNQVEAGAQMVQLFDSWAGTLDPARYTNFVLPHSQRILEAMKSLGVPTIHFGISTGELLPLMAQAGADVVGVDWRTPLTEARKRTGGNVALQGNLDPAYLFASPEVLDQQVRQIMADNASHPGHIFNLGHGVLPDANPDQLKRVVELVHTEGRANSQP